MLKMTGFEYKKFYNSDWDELLNLPGAFVDCLALLINGVESENIDTDDIKDTDKVTILSGCILADTPIDMSFETAFRRWKKQQTHAFLGVSVPKDKVDALKEFLKTIQGRVT